MSYSTHPTQADAGRATTPGVYIRSNASGAFDARTLLNRDVAFGVQAVSVTVRGRYERPPIQDDSDVRSTGGELENRFNELVNKWQEETGGQSSLSRITGNRHYLRIIAEFGEAAIPLILKRLETTPEPWFVALRAITGDYQVGSQYSGNFRKMADAWIEWGKQREYI